MPYKFTERRRHKFSKARHRVTNWPEYDAALVRRGSLTVWFTEEAVAAWRAPATRERGGQPIYSAIRLSGCVDGPSDAREKMRILTGGSIAIMCPASHEGVPCQVISSSASPSCLRALAHFNCLPRRSSRHSRALPCKPHIRRDDVPTTVPHSGRESSRRTAPLY